jgi:RNase adaptor protein for sRNA GlmZ degradation
VSGCSVVLSWGMLWILAGWAGCGRVLALLLLETISYFNAVTNLPTFA